MWYIYNGLLDFREDKNFKPIKNSIGFGFDNIFTHETKPTQANKE